jgi:Skp family chaperone for outer membrane proteins
MKRLLVLVTAAFLLLSVTGALAQARKKRIAIMDFDYATVHSASAALFGQDVDIGKGVAGPAGELSGERRQLFDH